MKQYIYTLSNPENSDDVRYIGKTKNLKDRLKRHMSDYSLKESWTSKNKWLLYLKNNNMKPKMEILDVGNENNIDDLERYWISQFKSWGFKLKNETEGGDGYDWTGKKHKKESVVKMKMNHPLRKSICQYDLNGNLINEFLSSHDAEKETGLHRGHISKCCKKIKNYNTVGGFYFRFKDEYFPLEKPSNHPCKVKCLDTNGNLVKTYKSLYELKKLGFRTESIKDSSNKNRLYRNFHWEIN